MDLFMIIKFVWFGCSYKIARCHLLQSRLIALFIINNNPFAHSLNYYLDGNTILILIELITPWLNYHAFWFIYAFDWLSIVRVEPIDRRSSSRPPWQSISIKQLSISDWPILSNPIPSSDLMFHPLSPLLSIHHHQRHNDFCFRHKIWPQQQ